jgi:2-polyprenyl-6-hydroxyphenyl methylase/3-demethylubiquinone-9 3-methyltransferase
MTVSPSRPQAPTVGATSTANAEEISRFARIAAAWWDPGGEFRPLHRLNPVRATYVRDRLSRHFGRDSTSQVPLAGLAIIDIGCGGGLLSESLAAMGARVVGIDAETHSIEIARHHATAEGLAIDYRVALPEDLAATRERFDAVVTMEVIEHVADLDAFLRAAADLLAPGGVMIIATINRTLKSLALAKIGAEYVLRWLPIGTHDWRKFVQPTELARLLRRHGLVVSDSRGFRYDPLTDSWSLGRDLTVNYVLTAIDVRERE